jgi:hypothetical protein
MLKLKQLIGAQGQRSVSPTLIVAELNLVHTGGEPLDDRANLAPPKALADDIFEQRNHRE